ncbi:UNVERIFIED_ORG: putative membrane channel-forming protein YqfA (hemolysin III family) [Heyndrickxia coagulans]
MGDSFKNKKKDGKPIFLTLILLMAAIVFLMIIRQIQNVNLWVVVIFYSMIDMGFLVAMIWGIRTKNKPVVVLSVLLNGVLFIVGAVFTYLLLMAIAIGGPI